MVTKQRLAEANAIPKWVSSERQLADGLTTDSATQLLADRLRTHRNRLSDDITYQAARKKDPARRAASAAEFALTKSQALGTALFCGLVVPAQGYDGQSYRPLDFVDVSLMLITILVAMLLGKLLSMPWTWASPRSRLVLRDQQT